ncbi:uncharacterized protein LOC100376111 [Saccoglossus kowalevskii]|uniref:Uncharacterized protein LOC100376111 n=1 Tax=Saccoglossus kowalevskii TaxID=10224 RepID=A0ABM0GPL2_SACKO|nr:PREDICTED: uncharacterized protein LOC100376111 [Saccoglossus kowalevskii]
MADPAPPAIPAVRIPVDKPVRLVGISHCNNSYSLIDHASSADNLHHVFHILIQNIASCVDDPLYYRTDELLSEFKGIGTDIKELARDRGYEETTDNYHAHHFKADHEAENKYLIAHLSEVAHYLVDYKNECCVESRGQKALDKSFLESVCQKHIEHIRNYRRQLAPFVIDAMRRTARIHNLSGPLVFGQEWGDSVGPLDDPNYRRPVPNECTVTRRETIGPRTDPPTVNGHRSGVWTVPSINSIPDCSGKPGSATSGSTGTLTYDGRYGGRHLHERDLTDRRRPLELEVRHVSSRYKHIYGLCE